MIIKEALKKYHKIEIELLLAHVLKKPKEFVFINTAHELTRRQADGLARMVKRRMAGEPMGYILGYKDFWGLRFRVNKDVLVPRPETEWVVGAVVQALGLPQDTDKQAAGLQYKSNIKILDIGTGSGAIIISLASTMGTVVLHNGAHCRLEFYASDISPAALVIAKQNAKKLLFNNPHTPVYGRIKFIKSDLLKNIKFNPDIIIANLPYGWHGVKNRFSSLKDGLKFEPQKALYAKEKGLFEIRRLLQQIAQRKMKPKLIYLEFDPRQKTGLNRLIKKYLPKGEIKFYKDFNNFWRYAEIKI